MPALTRLTIENQPFFAQRLKQMRGTLKIIGDLQQMIIDLDSWNANHPPHAQIHNPHAQEAWREANRVLQKEVMGQPYSLDRLTSLMSQDLLPVEMPLYPPPSTLHEAPPSNAPPTT